MCPQSFLLQLLVLALAVIDLATLEWARSAPLIAGHIALASLASTERALLAIWLVIGTPPTALRLLSCGLGLIICERAFAGPRVDVLPYVLFVDGSWGDWPFVMLFLCCLSARGFWKNFRDRFANASDVSQIGQWQFSIRDLLLLVTTVAMGLSVLRHACLRPEATMLGTIVLLSRAAIAFLVTQAVLSDRLSPAWFTAPFAVALLSAYGLERFHLVPLGTAWYPAAQWSLDSALLLAGLAVLRVADVRLTKKPPTCVRPRLAIQTIEGGQAVKGSTI